jgi:hypothetical protein
VLLLSSAIAVAGVEPAGALSFDPFAPSGAGGDVNGQRLEIGAGGATHEIDAFLAIAGMDLNGSAFGTASQLSVDPLPSGLVYSFDASLSADATDLILSYSFSNHTSATLSDVTFLSFLDAEIVEPLNSFFNENAVSDGSLAPGQGFEVDEPGFLFGDIFDHLLLGRLDDTNALPPGSEDDVSMALSFALGDLAPDAVAEIDIMISEDGDRLGPLRLTQGDDLSPTSIHYSGRARVRSGGGPAIPEPGAALLFAAGALVVSGRLRRSRR